MVKKWTEDIRTKTKNMTREQAVEYVLSYYWYHILLILLCTAAVILLIYHVRAEREEKEFTLAIINQETDFARDRELEADFSAFSGIDKESIRVDSDYLISYADIQFPDANESAYEKFFFNWASDEIDAVILTESFLDYCKNQGGELAELGTLFLEQEPVADQAELYKDGGRMEGIYLEKTAISEKLKWDSEDRIILVFPEGGKHEGACRQFLEYLGI